MFHFFISKLTPFYSLPKMGDPSSQPYSHPCNSMKAILWKDNLRIGGAHLRIPQASLLFLLIFLSISLTIPRISKDKLKNNSFKRKDTLEDNFIAGLRRYHGVADHWRIPKAFTTT